MRAISLWQPWASLWCSPRKVHETRHWPITYVGPIAVHAARRLVSDPGWNVDEICAAQFGNDWRRELPRGAVIGVVNIVACNSTEEVYPDGSKLDDYWCGDFSAGRFAWQRGEFRLLSKPIPLLGRQGFFQVPDELLREVA